MTANSDKRSRVAFDGKRGTTFWLRAYDIRKVGGSGPNDVPAAGHPLADPEANRPVKPETKASIRMNGQFSAIKIWKDNEGYPLCVFGRGRLDAVREINDEDGTTGTDNEMLVLCELVPPGTSIQELEEISMAENAHRKQNNPLTAAQKAAAYIKRHGSDPETLARCANANNLSVPRLEQLLTLLGRGSSKVVKAIKDGELGVQAALALMSLPLDEQDSKVETARSTGVKLSTRKAQAAARESKGHRTAPTKKEIKAELAKLSESGVDSINPILVLRWIVGDADMPNWGTK